MLPELQKHNMGKVHNSRKHHSVQVALLTKTVMWFDQYRKMATIIISSMKSESMYFAGSMQHLAKLHKCNHRILS